MKLRAMASNWFWPGPAERFSHQYVSFLRNGNHFPDSGYHRAALHEAVRDPEETFKQILYIVMT